MVATSSLSGRSGVVSLTSFLFTSLRISTLFWLLVVRAKTAMMPGLV